MRSEEGASSANSIQINDLKSFGKKAKAAHKRAQKAAKAAVEAVLDMGEQLLKARELMRTTNQRGFGKWGEELGITRMTANKAIRVYERLGHCATVDQLGLTTCYQLASGATPDAAVDEVLQLTDSGPVDANTVQEIIKKYRPSTPERNKPAPIILSTVTGTTAIQLNADGDDPIQALQEAIDAYRAGRTAAA